MRAHLEFRLARANLLKMHLARASLSKFRLARASLLKFRLARASLSKMHFTRENLLESRLASLVKRDSNKIPHMKRNPDRPALVKRHFECARPRGT